MRHQGINASVVDLNNNEIPVFDFRALAAATIPKLSDHASWVSKACLEHGCFSITNTPMGVERTDELLDLMRVFFELDDDNEIKQAVHRRNNGNEHGWTPLLEEPAYDPGTISWVESFDCGPSCEQISGMPEDERMDHPVSIWPDLEGFRTAVRNYWKSLDQAALALLPVLSCMLGKEPGFLSRHCLRTAPDTLRLLSYPLNPRPSDELNVGISAHTDFEVITIIYQTAEGLEVQNPEGGWGRVPVHEGQFVVLLGDMYERWSNGTFMASRHRVANTPWPRQSIARFFAANGKLSVQPLPAFLSKGQPARFEPVTQLEHIEEAIERAEKNRQDMLEEVDEALRDRPGR
jgi:isopenicillin N synthase-like dioxygenase